MSKKATPGVDDLKTLYPKLLEDWDYELNEKGPEEYLPGSSKSVHWKCHVCGHNWKAQITCRAKRNYGCPACSGRVAIKGKNDLATMHPDIAEEWNYKMNGKNPDEYSYGSKQVVWWVCPEGHEYQQHIDKRTLRGFNCPICSGHRTVKGINDFATIYPNIAVEWHPIENGSTRPEDFSSKNDYRARWICKYGHEWDASIHDRASGTGCPYCKNRYSSSFAEQAIYYYVKKNFPDAENRYKDLFDNNMELDIFIPSKNTAIEFDGAYWHNTPEIHEKERLKYQICKQHGIHLIRVKEHNGKNWKDVAKEIYRVKKEDTNGLQTIIVTILKGLNENGIDESFVDLERDRKEILEYLHTISNSLVDLRPDLVKEWNAERNGNLTPDLFGVNSNEKAWWRCIKCGHEWETTIIQRAGKRNSGCPTCSGIQKGKTFTINKVKERGSLADNCSELLKQWDYERNIIKPTEITSKCNKYVWWKCNVCGYSWESSPNNRSKGVGCPCCSGRVPKLGVNDLKTVNPELCIEWDYEKNGELLPEQFLPNSHKKVWWKCTFCGKEWEAFIGNRKNGIGCQSCKQKRRYL